MRVFFEIGLDVQVGYEGRRVKQRGEQPDPGAKLYDAYVARLGREVFYRREYPCEKADQAEPGFVRRWLFRGIPLRNEDGTQQHRGTKRKASEGGKYLKLRVPEPP